MRALVTTGQDASWLELREVPEPQPAPSEAMVRVQAISLNRGEVRGLKGAQAGGRPGWDAAGVIERPAADGSGPPAGTRVVGRMPQGAWAERVAMATAALAAVPDEVAIEHAAALPVAGLTAYRALAIGGMLLKSRVLVTGAAGGVGRYAVQLARLAGAHVTAVAASATRAAGLKELGADDVCEDITQLLGPYDLILESVGGPSLEHALQIVAPGGSVVSYGNSSGAPTTVSGSWFGAHRGAQLYAFVLGVELDRFNSGSRDLRRLLELVAQGRLDPQVSETGSWRDPQQLLEGLVDRRIAGKAVLTVD